MQNPKVLVLGASGRIGRILRKCWSERRASEQVAWQVRGQTQGRAQGQTRRGSENGWVTFDPLREPGALARAASGCAAILCLAGVVNGRLGQGGELGDNITLAEAAMRAGAVSGARVFLASSAAVYGNQTGVLKESSTLNTISDYAKAKAAMEARGAALGTELGVQVCALRIGNIAGIDAILGGWKPGFRLDQFPDGRTPRRSYIGMVTLARILGDLVLGDLVPGENLAGPLPQALNIAAPGMVEMGALLDAAGLAWAPRPAPQGAIEQVCLSTALLERITPLPKASAALLVAEWRVMQERMKDLKQ